MKHDKLRDFTFLNNRSAERLKQRRSPIDAESKISMTRKGSIFEGTMNKNNKT